MTEEFEVEEAPAEIQEYMDHIPGLAKNKAILVKIDGSVTEELGPKSLRTEANETDGAVALVINGPVSDSILDIAAEAAIETVVGTKKGKGYSERDDVTAWMTES